jgi:hypothetical protein
MTFIDRCRTLVAEFVALLVPDWQIQVEFANIYPLLGECYPSWEYKGGLLRFHDVDQWPIDAVYDLELTVAHEVGHCVLAVMCTEAGTWQRRAEEWIVETFARALVALRRGLKREPARLAAEMRALMTTTVARRRTASAERKRMDPELAKLIMELGAMLETEQVSAELRAAIEALVARATGGDATIEPEAPPAATPPEEQDARPALDEPAMRKGIARNLAQAHADSIRTAALARTALSAQMIASAPDVFPEALHARRARYATASPEEIERYIASVREERAADPRHRAPPQAAPAEGPGKPVSMQGAPPPTTPAAKESVIPIRRTGIFATGGE